MQGDAVAIVLAGGRSRRFGPSSGGKAVAELAGESLLGRVCRTLAVEVGRVIVVAAPGQRLPLLPEAVDVVRDTAPGSGPLAGLRDGLRHALVAPPPAARVAVIASCDVPLLRGGVVRMLLDAVRRPGVRWAVPHVHGHPQVLVSAVAVGLAAEIDRAVAAGVSSPRAMLAAFTGSSPEAVVQLDAGMFRDVDPELESFADVDTPDDLVRLGSRPSSPSPG